MMHRAPLRMLVRKPFASRAVFSRLWPVLCLVLAGVAGQAPVARAQDAPDSLPVKLMDGTTRTLGDYRGKVVVLSFWTVDCTNCKAEMPHIDRLYKAHEKEGLEVLGVNLDPPRNASRVKPTVRRYGYSFPIALDPEGELAAPFDPARATPCTVVLDRKGKTRYTHLGYRVGDEVELEKVVLEILSEGALNTGDGGDKSGTSPVEAP